MYKIGNTVVYPSHGLGIIESIEEKNLMGTKQKFYILKIMEKGTRIMIPCDNAEKVGLREVIPSNDVRKVVKVLKEKPKTILPNWNKRYRESVEKIKSGSIYEVAAVFRNLSLLSKDKELSFGEKKMLCETKHLISSEISRAKGITEQQAEKILDTALK
ncbi:MAG: CarD family transcriptional regulator [Nitrospirae bacterium CG_4_9_14_3_um_filter_53_35]|nr:MAG: CarD family transcriptional regulator [Nitrospirae bacterium CG2_30_53_67]PIX86654.1 MAG: CarD family transcriptional regulator [Nitrospirae bacterium CG_4_10_14_3_um_filter_53_41]PJA72939.1 MAG: CarD family transcriptional regulator [Nitrospirae bacterium CG_4_9_14_3_um_filter_53_35]